MKEEKGMASVEADISTPKKNAGITLIGLVVTIIVLLILARSKYKCGTRRQWRFNKCFNGCNRYKDCRNR